MNLTFVVRRLEDVTATILDWFPAAKTAEQAALGREFAHQLQVLAEAGHSGAGSVFWQEICGRLARCAAEDDPLFFMRWEPIRETMVHGSMPGTFPAWWHLRRHPDWAGVWSKALRHPQHGHPPPFLPMLSTNAMAIEHATHLCRFRDWAGTPFQDADCVMEFGGGFGSMCRMIHALGYKGTYTVFDLPPVLLLQQYYLALHGLRAGQSGAEQIRLCGALEQVEAALAERSPKRLAMISTWALSEMPLALRQRIETFLEHPALDHILLAYQAGFEGQDNRRYFADLRARLGDRFDWLHMPTGPSYPDGSPHASFYLFGRRL